MGHPAALDLPTIFFLQGVFFHQLGEDRVAALQFGFELFDLLLLCILDGLAFAAVVEGEVAVLEEVLEPSVELGGVDVAFICTFRKNLPPARPPHCAQPEPSRFYFFATSLRKSLIFSPSCGQPDQAPREPF